jgi:hypothetical protein
MNLWEQIDYLNLIFILYKKNKLKINFFKQIKD